MGSSSDPLPPVAPAATGATGAAATTSQSCLQLAEEAWAGAALPAWMVSQSACTGVQAAHVASAPPGHVQQTQQQQQQQQQQQEQHLHLNGEDARPSAEGRF